jgi:hypothetical protein
LPGSVKILIPPSKSNFDVAFNISFASAGRLKNNGISKVEHNFSSYKTHELEFCQKKAQNFLINSEKFAAATKYLEISSRKISFTEC